MTAPEMSDSLQVSKDLPESRWSIADHRETAVWCATRRRPKCAADIPHTSKWSTEASICIPGPAAQCSQGNNSAPEPAMESPETGRKAVRPACRHTRKYKNTACRDTCTGSCCL